MNSKQPITEEALEQAIRNAMMGDFNDLYVPQFTTDWEVQRKVRIAEIDVMTPKRLTALCRQFAASELRAAAGEDELTVNAGNTKTHYEMARNLFRRTLRVRADELEAGK